jgi:hypothetical protein
MTGQAGDFHASVLRADDLLALTFDCFNLRLDRPQGRPPRLSRVTAGQPAFIVVGLAAQHIAERFMTDSIQRLVPSLMANRSRLAFRVADDMDSLPFSLEALLDWAPHSLSVTANAVAQLAGPERPGPAEPALTQTAIELPRRLVLSPDAGAGWAHAVEPVVHDIAGQLKVAELWHTRLGGRQDGRVDESRMPTVRAVWAHNLFDPPTDTLGSPLDDAIRSSIVMLSSDFTQTITRLGPGLPQGEEIPYDPLPLHATHLVLSALGGWTDIRGEWDFPAPPGADEFPLDHVVEIWPSSPLVGWRHIVAQGRDQYVRVVQRGFLYPLGHRAVLERVYERKLAPGTETEFLWQTVLKVAVREPVRDYAQFSASHANNAKLPLRRARIETMVTPNLEGQPEASFIPTVQGEPFRFHVVGEDWEGQRIDLHMPLVFVTEQDARQIPALLDSFQGPLVEYRDSDSLRTVDLGGQPVALAPHPPAPLATSLPVQHFTFTHQDTPGLATPFLPYIEKAAVRVPSIDRLVGAYAPVPPVEVELADPERTAGQVFARLSESNPLDLRLPAERAGGLARPNLSIRGLSRSLGAVPDGLDQLAAGNFDPAKLFSGSLGDTTLLGGIRLVDVIGKIVDSTHLPGVTHRESPDGVDVMFQWKPPLKREGFGPLQLAPGAALTLRTDLHLPAGSGAKPRLTVDGLLTRFALDFADVVRVGIDSLRFHAEDGKKLDVDVQGVHLVLRNELSFLNELASVLPANGFSDPPALRVTPEGVTAEYSLGIPAAGIGIFSLENVAVSAGIVLPFVNRPAALRLAFSERAHPFLVSVSAIGGAGFFALEVDTAGIRRLEASIELGANLTVSLGVASANAHVMAGFYFGLRKGTNGRPDDIDFSAYLRVGGAVELLGIAGISFEIYLTMTYEPAYRPTESAPPRPSIGGRAAVVVAAHLLMFTTHVTLSYQKWFDVPALDPSFEDLVDADDWETYCRAFA